MERHVFPVVGWKLFLQIGQNYSEIPIDGCRSYACCGKSPIILYTVKHDYAVVALKMTGGYIDRIHIKNIDESVNKGIIDDETVSVYFMAAIVDVYTRGAGANPKIVPADPFRYEWRDVL